MENVIKKIRNRESKFFAVILLLIEDKSNNQFELEEQTVYVKAETIHEAINKVMEAFNVNSGYYEMWAIEDIHDIRAVEISKEEFDKII